MSKCGICARIVSNNASFCDLHQQESGSVVSLKYDQKLTSCNTLSNRKRFILFVPRIRQMKLYPLLRKIRGVVVSNYLYDIDRPLLIATHSGKELFSNYYRSYFPNVKNTN